jgi:hypothetical protein
MTKVLHKWGLGPVLKERAHKCDRFFFTNGNSPPKWSITGSLTTPKTAGNTGDLIGCMNMGEGFLEDLSADFLFLQVRYCLDSI